MIGIWNLHGEMYAGGRITNNCNPISACHYSKLRNAITINENVRAYQEKLYNFYDVRTTY